jgi:alkaline phosphatase
MRLRNQLLALFCLLVFIGLGLLYFRPWSKPKPFAVILFVGDGLTSGNLTAARLFEGGADHRLAIQSFPNVAVVSNHANDFAVPDDAAAATALATGAKVNHRAIGIDPQGKTLASIIEIAHERGRATGLITTGSLADSGAAAFYAHAPNGNQTEAIAAQFADSAKLDVALGGGALDFLADGKGGRRKDGRDLIEAVKQKGGTIVRTKAELENTPVFGTRTLLGLFANGSLSFNSQIEAGSQQPSLSDMVRRAIEFLEDRPSGYLLVVDSALIARALEINDAERAITETLELNRAVATATRYAGKNALIIAVGRHATGGMTLNGYPLRADHGVALLGKNPSGYPSITWASGPNGPLPESSAPKAPPSTPTPAPTPPAAPAPPAATPPAEKPAPPPAASPAPAQAEPAAVWSPSAFNTAEDVLAAGIGPGSQDVKGFLDNTQIFQILEKNL